MASFQHYVDTAATPGGDGLSQTHTDDGSGHRAYASLSEWETAISANNNNDVFVVDCAGSSADTTAVTVDVPTTITTGSITIRGDRAAPDNDGYYDDNLVISTAHYRLNAGDSALTTAELNCTIDGIQVIPTGGAFRHGISNNNGGCVTKNCRLHTTSSTAIGIGLDVSIGHNATVVYENNLIVGFDNGFKYTADSFRTPNVTFRHNTIYGDGTSAGIRFTCQANGGGTWTIKGNAIANNGTGNDIIDGATGVGSATVTYADNALQNSESTTDEIALGTTTDAWTDPGTTAADDFTVKDTSSSLYNAVNPTLVATDITGYTRDGTNHDVGCFEFTGGAPAAPETGIMTTNTGAWGAL